MSIVAFGTYDSEKHPRIGIVVDGLREHGFAVRELNHPLGFSTAERVRMLQRPWLLPKLGLRLLGRWRRLAREARRLRTDHGEPRTVLVGYLGHFDVLFARRVFPRSTIVLDHLIFAGDTAQDRGAEGLRVRLLHGLDVLAIRAADLVLVDTVEHLAMLPAGAQGLHVPVGARREWFAARAEHTAPPAPLSVIFFGLFTPLQGAVVIAEALAAAHAAGAAFTATVVGTGQDYAEARAVAGALPEVEWIDWVDPAALPALVASHDVCLGVFGGSGKALRVVPNKVYEGAAAGCAIVTSGSAPQRAAFPQGALFAEPGDAASLTEAIGRLAADRELLERLRSEAAGQAERFTSSAVVAELVERLRATA